jgi:hypothetical protein
MCRGGRSTTEGTEERGGKNSTTKGTRGTKAGREGPVRTRVKLVIATASPPFGNFRSHRCIADI